MKIEVLWSQLLEQGLEHLILEQNDHKEANGLAIGSIKGVGYRIKYQIICDAGWNAQNIRVEDLLNEKEIVLVKSGNNDWVDESNKTLKALNHCTDVDIMVTPFTNTLPIRRMNLALHESREISVMYVSIPDLSVSRLSQRYTYLSQEKDSGLYKYENLNSGFTSEITVDSNGLVTDYPDIFKMVWKSIGGAVISTTT